MEEIEEETSELPSVTELEQPEKKKTAYPIIKVSLPFIISGAFYQETFGELPCRYTSTFIVSISLFFITQHTDVPEENKADIVDTITDAIERFGADYDVSF